MPRGAHRTSCQTSTLAPHIALFRGNRLSTVATLEDTRFGVRTPSSKLVGKVIKSKGHSKFRWSEVPRDSAARTDDAAHYQRLANSARSGSDIQRYFLRCVQVKYLESERTIPAKLVSADQLSLPSDSDFSSSPSLLWSTEFEELTPEVSAHVATNKPEVTRSSSKPRTFDVEQLRQQLTRPTTNLFFPERYSLHLAKVGLLISYPSKNVRYIKPGHLIEAVDPIFIGGYHRYKGSRYYSENIVYYSDVIYPAVSSLQLFESPDDEWDFYYMLPPSPDEKEWWNLIVKHDINGNLAANCKRIAKNPNRTISTILGRASVNGRIFLQVAWGKYQKDVQYLRIGEVLYVNPDLFQKYWEPIVLKYLCL